MKNAIEKIKAGLEDARGYLKGDARGAVTHRVWALEPDVAAIRAKSGLSQRVFASSIGVAVATLQGWEHGRRRPKGPARVLLALIDKRPGIVEEALRTR